jgi:multiple sugar transport system permease protein
MRHGTRLVQYSLLLAWAFVCLFPVAWLILASFKSPQDQFGGPHYVPYAGFTPTLEAWAFILADAHENLLWPLFNSLVAGLAATAICVLLGGFAVYGVTRLPARRGAMHIEGEGLLFGLLATRLLPPVVLALPLYVMAQHTGTRDSLASLILVYAAINLPVAIWLLRPVLGGRASEMEESARLEGASHLRVFFELVLPVSASGFAAVAILVFILCWNEYLLAAYLTAGRAMTLPVWTAGQLSMKDAQVGGEAEEWAHLSAATVLMTLPVLLATAFVQRALGKLSVWRRG